MRPDIWAADSLGGVGGSSGGRICVRVDERILFVLCTV